MSDAVKVKFNYGFVRSKFGSLQTQNTDAPKHSASLNTDWALTDNVNMNMTWRYVDKVNLIASVINASDSIESYQSVDLGLSWRVANDITVSLHGKDLFLGPHLEYTSEFYTLPYRIEPSVYGKVSIEF